MPSVDTIATASAGLVPGTSGASPTPAGGLFAQLMNAAADGLGGLVGAPRQPNPTAATATAPTAVATAAANAASATPSTATRKKTSDEEATSSASKASTLPTTAGDLAGAFATLAQTIVQTPAAGGELASPASLGAAGDTRSHTADASAGIGADSDAAKPAGSTPSPTSTAIASTAPASADTAAAAAAMTSAAASAGTTPTSTAAASATGTPTPTPSITPTITADATARQSTPPNPATTLPPAFLAAIARADAGVATPDALRRLSGTVVAPAATTTATEGSTEGSTGTTASTITTAPNTTVSPPTDPIPMSKTVDGPGSPAPSPVPPKADAPLDGAEPNLQTGDASQGTTSTKTAATTAGSAEPLLYAKPEGHRGSASRPAAATPAGADQTSRVAAAGGPGATADASPAAPSDAAAPPAAARTPGGRETVADTKTDAATTAAADLGAAPKGDATVRLPETGVARVETAAGAAATDAARAVPLAAVAQTIATRAHTGHSRFDIRLDPAELGGVDVRVEIRSNGEVRAHLVVERTETLDLMLRDQKNLERSLTDAGLDVGSSGLQFSLKEQTTGQGGQGWRTYDEAATRRDPVVDPEAEAAAAAQTAALAYRPSRGGGVDLRV